MEVNTSLEKPYSLPSMLRVKRWVLRMIMDTTYSSHTLAAIARPAVVAAGRKANSQQWEAKGKPWRRESKQG